MKKPKLTEFAVIDQIPYNGYTITKAQAWNKKRTYVETYYGVNDMTDNNFDTLIDAKKYIDDLNSLSKLE